MTIKTKSYVFVALQFALLVSIVILPGEQTADLLQVLGLILICTGLIVCSVAIWQLRKFSLTALPTPIKNAALLDTGLYSLVRHPIYTGLMSTILGVVVCRYSLLRLFLLVSLAVLLYEKTKFEEAELTKTFGKRYRDYMAKTRRFL